MANKDYESALQYVRDNKKWNATDEMYAFNVMEDRGCELMTAAPNIATQIFDLMEEYGQEYDLPEGWWMWEGNETDVFLKL